MIKCAQCRYGPMMYLSNDKWIGKSYELYGETLESEIQLIRYFVRPGDIVIDAGANIGGVTIPLAQMVGEAGHVHAFEPQEFISYVLRGNIALNDLYNVKVWQRPLDSCSDKILYCVNKQLKNLNGVYFYDEEGQHHGGLPMKKEPRFDNDVTVLTKSIDDLHLDRLDFIKMDIEGAELDALQGAEQTIKEHQPVMLVEAMPKLSPKIVEYMESIDYTHHKVSLPFFNKDNWKSNEVDHLRDSHNPDAPMMSSDMVCYPKSKQKEMNLVMKFWRTK